MKTLNCPLCQKEFEPWMTLPADWRRPAHGGAYQTFWCKSCEFGQIGPRPDPETIASFYEVDSYYTHTAADGVSRENAESFAHRLKTHLAWRTDKSVELDAAWIREHLGTAGKDVCDVGCGSGGLLALLREAGHRVTGVEPDPAARKAASDRHLTVLPGTAEALPAELNGRRFDAVFMSHVLEHCRDPLAALRNVRALLAPGGKLIVETPNNLARGLSHAGAAWYWLDVPRHLNFFTPQSLKRSFEAAGLHVEATEFRGYTRQFSTEWIHAEDLIRERLNAAESAKARKVGNSEWTSWRLLGATAFARDEEKYDSVRVLAAS